MIATPARQPDHAAELGAAWTQIQRLEGRVAALTREVEAGASDVVRAQRARRRLARACFFIPYVAATGVLVAALVFVVCCAINAGQMVAFRRSARRSCRWCAQSSFASPPSKTNSPKNSWTTRCDQRRLRA